MIHRSAATHAPSSRQSRQSRRTVPGVIAAGHAESGLRRRLGEAARFAHMSTD